MFRFFLMSALIAGAAAPLASTTDAAPLSPVANPSPASTQASRRNYFLGVHSLANWTYSPGANLSEAVLTSPPLAVPISWNELVPSWNATLPPDAKLTVEVRALFAATASEPAHATKYYMMGQWSGDSAKNPRQSVKAQKDEDGDVDTDTLKLKRHGAQLQVRLTFSSEASIAGQSNPRELGEKVRFLGLSFLDGSTKATEQEPNRAAWGTTLPVPERFQLDYKDIGGKVWCSPTSVSMILAHWSNVGARPELTMTIPHVAGEVLDPNWPGTGNWSFNASFAGSLPGVRGYVARFDDLCEVESWIAAGVPVALSVNHALLQGKPRDKGGHLVVCVGFTKTGDAVIADPYFYTKPDQPYHIFPRKDVVAGWGASRNTVYLIYPETLTPPTNTAQHWDG